MTPDMCIKHKWFQRYHEQCINSIWICERRSVLLWWKVGEIVWLKSFGLDSWAGWEVLVHNTGLCREIISKIHSQSLWNVTEQQISWNRPYTWLSAKRVTPVHWQWSYHSWTKPSICTPLWSIIMIFSESSLIITYWILYNLKWIEKHNLIENSIHNRPW